MWMLYLYSLPEPGKMFTTPFGIPAFTVSSANFSAVNGVTCKYWVRVNNVTIMKHKLLTLVQESMKYDIGLGAKLYVTLQTLMLHLSFDPSTLQVADLKYQQQCHIHFIMDKARAMLFFPNTPPPVLSPLVHLLFC